MEEQYTGRFINIEKAIESAHEIVIAEVIDPGVASPGAPGQVYFDNAKVQIVTYIASKLRNKRLPKELCISYTCQKLPEGISEHLLNKGELLVFFMEIRTDKTVKAIKILRATKDNLKSVNEALAKKKG